MGEQPASLLSSEPIFPVADVVATVRYYRDVLVKDIMVLPEWQCRGVGSRIVQALLAIIRREAVDGMLVALFTGQGLAAFYEQFGFRGPDAGLYGMTQRIRMTRAVPGTETSGPEDR